MTKSDGYCIADPKEARKARREAWKLAGTCPSCGSRPIQVGYSRCIECRAVTKASNVRAKLRLRAKKLRLRKATERAKLSGRTDVEVGRQSDVQCEAGLQWSRRGNFFCQEWALLGEEYCGRHINQAGTELAYRTLVHSLVDELIGGRA